MMEQINILILEDDATDAELTLQAVRRAGFNPTWVRVDTEPDFRAQLNDNIDVILADYSMPQFSAVAALEILKHSGLDIPLIIVSGTIGEETAVEAMKLGAADYLLKDRLTRLGNAIRFALEQKQLTRDKARIAKALYEAESKYRSIFENATEGIYQATMDGRYITANPALARMFGYASPEDLIAGISDINTELYVDGENRRRFFDLLTTHGIATNFESRVNTRNGRLLCVTENARIVRDADGGILYIEGFIQDITDRQHAEEKLLRAQKMEAIGRFAGGVAHDFNNIITVIIGVADLIKADVRDKPHALENLREINRAAQQASLLTRQLLSFGRKQIMEVKVFDLRSLLASIENMLTRVFGEDVDLKIYSDTNPHFVKADPNQIEQVLLNLATNARDAMPKGGKLTIALSRMTIDQSYIDTHAQAMAGDYERISVTDSGTGMTQDIMRHIFEPFFTTKEVGKGSGLGLATSFGIIKQSGGFISVYSEPGIGSTFNVYLPADQAACALRTDSDPKERPAKGSEKVLLVEDDPALQKLSRITMERLGYTVITASNGEEALSVLSAKAEEIDLVITDVIMPKLGGKALVDQIKEKWPQIRYLFCSGYSDHAIDHHGMLDDDTPFLQKPYSPRQLGEKLREVLEGRR